jgi:hypothetical protein
MMSDPSAVAISDLVEALDLDVDRDAADPSDIDQFREQAFSGISSELRRRTDALNGAYPFATSSDGLKLLLRADLQPAHHTYLFSLVLSHAIGSEWVPKRVAPSAREMRVARDLFQVCSTAAAAGHTGGPSFSIGWPRTHVEPFHEALKHAWSHFGDGGIVETPPDSIPEAVKDDGLDVLSFWLEKDGGPSRGYVVGQAASGRNWKSKSAKPVIDILKAEWLHPQPSSTAHPVTFIPFQVSPDEARRVTVNHGYVMSRLRLPRCVGIAFELNRLGVAPIERLDEFGRVAKWLARRIKSARKNLS